ncbi:MAG: 3-oxoacyl-[acyl-carrier-protein] synthase III C-terminal domain-containing protein, partial [Myxococcota bacterium]
MLPNILGVGTYFPRQIKANADFDYLAAGVTPERVARGGVQTRRWAANDESIIDLADGAARQALAASGVAPEDIDRLVLVTSTMQPGLLVPTGAVRLQTRLGLLRAQALTLIETCCGALVGMELASGMIRGGLARNALVVASETFSKTFNPTSPTTFEIGMSMGDGAGAVVLGPRDGWSDGLIASYGSSGASFQSGLGMRPIGSGGNGTGARVAFGVGAAPPSRDGVPLARSQIVEALKQFTTMTIPAAIREVLSRAELDVEDIDLFLLHQPNRMFLEAWKAEVGIPGAKTLDTLEQLGNLSSVSVIANLDAAWRSGRLAPEDRIVLASAGEGAVWGAMAWNWRLPAPGLESEQASWGGLINVERHSKVELLDRLALHERRPFPVTPGMDRAPCDTLVLRDVPVGAVFDYLADLPRLGEWTMSWRALEPVDGGVHRARDAMSPTEQTFVRVRTSEAKRSIEWELGHRPDRLWVTRRVVLADALQVIGRPGTAMFWTTTRQHGPVDTQGERFAELVGASLGIELQNLKQILLPGPARRAGSAKEKGSTRMLS